MNKWKKLTMPNFTDLTGLVSVASAATAVMLQLPGVTQLVHRRKALLSGAVLVVLLAPFGVMPFAAYLRGITGDLSITTLILSWCAMLRHCFGRVAVEPKQRLVLLGLIAFSAIVFYPMALGAGAYDPYRLGYGDPLFITVLLLFAFVAWLRGLLLISLCTASATLAWAVGWYESGNLLDYLLDPLLAVYALATFISFGLKRLFDLRREKPG
jgi:hypothetical protein